MIKNIFKKYFLVYGLIKFTKKKLRKKYTFERKQLMNGDNHVPNFEVSQVSNLLNYTKTSESPYAAKQFPAGYHSVTVKGQKLSGRRDPANRVKTISDVYEFNGKSVLDIGSNQGGVLFELADTIHHGTGIDYDHRMINVANKIKSVNHYHNLDFYVFDLDKEDFNLIKDLMHTPRVDVVLLFAVCVWIKTWKQLIHFTSTITDTVIFESNGSEYQQELQVRELGKYFKEIKILSAISKDDLRLQTRKLYLCTK